MPKDEIVDSSQEMALDDPKIAEFLAAAHGDPAPETKPDKTDVKEKRAASSAASDEPTETPDDLKAQIKGLQAELTRRRGNSDKVESLEVELNSLKEKLASPANEEFKWIQKLDDDGLASKQTDWDDELADARAKYGRAEESGDDRLMEKHGHRILTAKKTLSAFRKEALDRNKRVNEEANAYKESAQSIHAEIDSMREHVLELMPDLITQGSEAWEAGNEEYNTHPHLMRQLGPLGEVVAAAMAVIKNPDLIGKKTTAAARKEVIGSLEKSVKKSLSTGSSASNTSRSVDYASGVQSGEGLAAFNQMIDKIKGG